MRGRGVERNDQANEADFQWEIAKRPRAALPVAVPELTKEISATATSDPLGEPLGIRAVARLIGCSPWTVRHVLLPQGLPHFRAGRKGKLIFYRNQILRWVLYRQQKGGRIR